jgi:uncharacterized damage-inducible protein DinB
LRSSEEKVQRYRVILRQLDNSANRVYKAQKKLMKVVTEKVVDTELMEREKKQHEEEISALEEALTAMQEDFQKRLEEARAEAEKTK